MDKATQLERGDLVRLVGMTGTGKALGEVRSVSGRGVLVTVRSTGNREYWHPSDVRRVRKACRGNR
jgi:hypothetical protein